MLRRRGDGLELAGTHLRVDLELPSGRLHLSAPRAGLAIRGCLPRVWVGARPLALGPAVLEDEVQQDGVVRLRLRWGCERALDLSLEIELARDGTGIRLAPRLENHSTEPVAIAGLDVLWARGENLRLPGTPSEWRFFRAGYQSWSPAGWLPLGARDHRPRLALSRTLHFGPCTPLPRRGLHVSDSVATLGVPDRAGWTLGFITQRRHLNWVALAHNAGQIQELCAHVATENLPLEAGEALSAEELWIGLDGPGHSGLAGWAEQTSRRMGVTLAPKLPSAWCSWYQFFTRVRAEDVRRNARALAERAPWIDTLQIDDGYQSAVGDWTEFSAGFPEGVAGLAREIRDSNRRPGLWLAPLLVSRSARLAERHPEWLLRDFNGRPRVAFVNPGWKGRVCHALDPSHPEVDGWLEELARTVRGWGYDYLKLDFLYAGALRGARFDRLTPTGAVYRNAIEALRRGAGSDSFLLGCGAPLGPSVGLFDAMRIGPDVAPRWRARLADAALGVRAAPSAENSLRNIVTRAPLGGRLWHNDPDCALLREKSHLSAAQVRTLLSAIALSGGLFCLSDELERLGETRERWLQRTHPPLHGTAVPLGVRGESAEALWRSLPDGSVWLLYLNLERGTRWPRCRLAELGLRGAVHAYDVWEERYLGVFRHEVPLPRLRRGHCRLLRLSPLRSHTQVIGSTLHLAGGGLEAPARPLGPAEIELALPGARSGRLLVACESGQVVAVRVAFRDRLVLEVESEPLALEDRAEMPDG